MKQRTTGLLNWLLLLCLLSQKSAAQNNEPQDQSTEILAALPPGLQLLQIVNVATWTINGEDGGNRFFYIYALKTPQGILYAGVYEEFDKSKKLVNKYRQFSTDFREIGVWLGLQEENIVKLSSVDPFADAPIPSTPPAASTPPATTTTTVVTKPPTSTTPSTVVTTQTTSPSTATSTGNVIIQNPPQPIITTSEPSKPVTSPPITVSQPGQIVTTTTVTQPPKTTVIPPNTATSTTTVSTNGQSTNIFQSPSSPISSVAIAPPTTVITGTQTTTTNVTTTPPIVQTPTGTVLVDNRPTGLPAQTGSTQVTVQNQPTGTVIVPTIPQPPTTTTTTTILPATTTSSTTMTTPVIPQPGTVTNTPVVTPAQPPATTVVIPAQPPATTVVTPAQPPATTVIKIQRPTLITPQTAPVITVENLRTIFTNQPAIWGSAYINPNIGYLQTRKPMAAHSRRQINAEAVILAQGNRSPIVIYPGIGATKVAVAVPVVEAQKSLLAEDVHHFHKAFRHSPKQRHDDD